MPLDQQDIELIADTAFQVVERVIAERMEQVYAVMEEIRGQMQATVGVLSGNDDALLAELRKVQHATPAEVLTMAGESWERFIRGEAQRIGLLPAPVMKKPRNNAQELEDYVMGDKEG